MEKFINDNGNIRELVQVVSKDSECGYVTTYRDAMKDGDVEFGVKTVAAAKSVAKAKPAAAPAAPAAPAAGDGSKI